MEHACNSERGTRSMTMTRTQDWPMKTSRLSVALFVLILAVGCSIPIQPPRKPHKPPQDVSVTPIKTGAENSAEEPIHPPGAVPELIVLTQDDLNDLYASPHSGRLNRWTGSKTGWSSKGGRQWKYILIHHSATDVGNAKIFDRQHREGNGWVNGLGYQFVIGNGTASGNGEVEVGRRWLRQIDGAHAGNAKYNKQSIGICLVGDFHKDGRGPSPGQMRSLVELIYHMQMKYDIPNARIRLHREVRDKGTVCPGKSFDRALLLRLLKLRSQMN